MRLGPSRTRPTLVAASVGVALLLATSGCSVIRWADEGAQAEQDGYASLSGAEYSAAAHDALPAGRAVQISDYSVIAREPVATTDSSLADKFPYAQPPAGTYILINVDTRYRGDQDLEFVDPSLDLEVRNLALDHRAYVESGRCGPLAVPDVYAPAPGPLSTAKTFTVCFDIPVGVALSGLVGIRDKLNPLKSKFVYWRF